MSILDWELLRSLLTNHRGKLGGALVGLLFGIFAVTWGLGKALFIMICLVVGYAIGSRLDNNKGFKQLIERFFGEW